MKFLRSVSVKAQDTTWTLRHLSALDGLHLQEMFNSNADLSEKEKTAQIIDFLCEVAIGVDGVEDEHGNPIDWKSLSESERKMLVGYNFDLLAELFQSYISTTTPSEEEVGK